MTVENSSTAPEALESTTIDAEAGEGLDINSESEELESASEGSTDPEESFADWQARRAGTNTPEKVAEPKVETKPEPEPAPKTLKIKVNGKESELAESEVIKRAQLYEASEQKFQAAAKMNKQAENLVQLLKDDPGQVLDKLGANKEAIEAWYYKTHIEPQLITPEQRAANEKSAADSAKDQELEGYRTREAEAKAAEQATKTEALKEQYRQDWSAKFSEALDNGGIPKTDWTITRMAGYMKQALSKGMKHIQPADVAKLVKADWDKVQQDMYGKLDAEKLAEALGEDALAKLRKHQAAKYKENKFKNSATPNAKPREKSDQPAKRYTSAMSLLDDL